MMKTLNYVELADVLGDLRDVFNTSNLVCIDCKNNKYLQLFTKEEVINELMEEFEYIENCIVEELELPEEDRDNDVLQDWRSDLKNVEGAMNLVKAIPDNTYIHLP